VTSGFLLLILHPEVNAATPRVLWRCGHLLRIGAERLGAPCQRVGGPDVVVIPRQLYSAATIKHFGSLDVPRQRTALLDLRNRVADASFGGFERRLAVRIVRRVLIHHAHGTYIFGPIVQVVVAGLAVHLPVHLLPIAARQVLPPSLEVV